VLAPRSKKLLLKKKLFVKWWRWGEPRSTAFGHKYFSVEKSRDPASRRRAPAFNSPISSIAQKNKHPFRVFISVGVEMGGIEPPCKKFLQRNLHI